MNELPHNVTTDDSTFRFWVVQTLTTLQVKLEGQISDKNDQETRLRRIEQKLWVATGVASTVSALVSAILMTIVRKFAG